MAADVVFQQIRHLGAHFSFVYLPAPTISYCKMNTKHIIMVDKPFETSLPGRGTVFYKACFVLPGMLHIQRHMKMCNKIFTAAM